MRVVIADPFPLLRSVIAGVFAKTTDIRQSFNRGGQRP